MKLYRAVKSYIDGQPWPAGFKYHLDRDLLEFWIYKDNVIKVATDSESLKHIESQVGITMWHIRKFNPACELKVVEHGG